MLVAHVRVSTEMVEELGKVEFTMQTFVLVGVDSSVDASVRAILCRCGRCSFVVVDASAVVRFTLVFGGVHASVKKGMEEENDTVRKGEMSLGL